MTPAIQSIQTIPQPQAAATPVIRPENSGFALAFDALAQSPLDGGQICAPASGDAPDPQDGAPADCPSADFPPEDGLITDGLAIADAAASSGPLPQIVAAMLPFLTLPLSPPQAAGAAATPVQPVTLAALRADVPEQPAADTGMLSALPTKTPPDDSLRRRAFADSKMPELAAKAAENTAPLRPQEMASDGSTPRAGPAPPDKPLAPPRSAPLKAGAGQTSPPRPATANPAALRPGPEARSGISVTPEPADTAPTSGVAGSGLALSTAAIVPLPGHATTFGRTGPQALFQGRAADLTDGDGPTPAARDASQGGPPPTALPLTAPGPTGLIPDLAATIARPEPQLPDAGLFSLPTGIPAFSPLASSPGVPGPVAALSAQIAVTLATGSRAVTEVALAPEELGHVRISLRSHASDPDRIVVMMTFERPDVMDLFRRNADQLQADLRAAGYSGADLGFSHSGSGQRQNSPVPDGHKPAVTTADQTTAFAPPTGARISSASLDLRL